jgi:hypothetical protein
MDVAIVIPIPDVRMIVLGIFIVVFIVIRFLWPT